MKELIFIGLFSFSLASLAQPIKSIDHFPEENHTYRTGVDTGFFQYTASSLYNTKKVVLTYDDGPHPSRTPKLLDVLKKYNVKATFFVLTQNITSGNMHIIQRILDEGHFLASHDHTHDNNNNETRATFKNDLKKSVLKIEEITDSLGIHVTESYFRFPYAAYGHARDYHHMNVLKEVSNEIYGENCINFVFWDIDTADWVPVSTPDTVTQNILAHIEGGYAFTHKMVNGKWTLEKYRVSNPPGGGIILMHDINKNAASNTEKFLSIAKEKGIQVVPINEAKNFNFDGKNCIVK